MPKLVLVYDGFWSKPVAQRHSKFLFIFGDNLVKMGEGGQAIIRTEPNALGIPTKKYPTNTETSFFSDKELLENMFHIDQAISLIKNRIGYYNGIILPKSGLGTGLAELDTRAPKTFNYLNHEVELLKEYVENYPG